MNALILFRNDLRLHDNPALNRALALGIPVVGCYIYEEQTRPLGGASTWFLDQALRSLRADLNAHAIPLILRAGRATDVVPEICDSLGVSHVLWNRRYDPTEIAIDTALKSRLKEQGRVVESHACFLLFEPWNIQNKSGSSFKVFTPFWRACLGHPAPRAPLAEMVTSVETSLQKKLGTIANHDVDTLKLLSPSAQWPKKLAQHWHVTEAAAHRQLADFCEEGLADYAQSRDFPIVPRGTSRVSAFLRFGLLSPHQCWHAAIKTGNGRSLERFLAELGWREFSYHLLYHVPDLGWKNVNPAFDRFPWANDHAKIACWHHGQTGIPIVDAGMRQLWQTGWMHNRVRMIVASFLTKHMGVHWHRGEAWFWDTLVDADPASNAAGWQWVAGCGADASPYFRIFNPVLQSKKFDADGAYIRTYVPALKSLSAQYIHAPWEADPQVLAASGLVLGRDYPEPILDLRQGRARALDAYAQIKQAP